MSRALVVGIDASTSACKAVVWDLDGQVVAEGRAGLSVWMPKPGWHEQPAKNWWSAMARALRMAVCQVDARRLAGLAIAHQRETFVPLDRRGEPLRNGIVWMDERAGGMLDGLAAELDRDSFHRETGKPLSGNLTVTKIAWLRAHEPDMFARTALWADVHAYLVSRLTGTARTGWGCADPTGLFDMARNSWSERVLHAIGVGVEQLPPALPPGALLGMVTGAAAKASGLPEGLPVFAGLGDGQAGGVGAGICTPGTAYLALGTSVISGTFSDHFVVDPAYRSMYGGVAGTYLLETVLLGGTYTLDWFFKTLLGKRGKGLVQLRDKLEQNLAQVPPGSHGLAVVPYWNSAMSPYWDATASGMILGLRGSHGPGELYRAILEGIALELRLQLQGVERSLGGEIRQLVAMGGGARSAGWRQIIADVTGKPVAHAVTPEAAALGAGILAAVGAGLFPSVVAAAERMSHWSPERTQPDAARHAFYSELFQSVYTGLYPAVRSNLARLSGLSERSGG